MDKWKEKFSRFMQGRYGMDDLGRFLNYILLALLVLSFFVRTQTVSFLLMALIVYLYFRMFSRNISARYAENRKLLELKRKFFGVFHGRRTPRDRTARIFVCPGCGQKVRVPRGKGKISIHCPKCHADFIRRS